MWIPCGFHVDSLDSTWNKFIPHGFHVECGGMVKYCHPTPPPPLPSPPIPLSTTHNNPESGPSPLLRDVGPILNASKQRDTKSNRTCPSSSQRDVGGSLLLNEGFGQGDTQGEIQEVGGPASPSRK